MPTNQIRRELLNRIKASNFPGSIVEVFQAADQGIDLISQFEQQQMQEQQMQVANTPQEQEIGLREQHAMGNTQASMAFPNVQPGQSFNTVGMKAPINIDKVDEQGHLVESYKNVPPGIQDLPTGPYKGTVIESPAGYQMGGAKVDPSTATPTIMAPDPVNKDLMKYSLNFECDTDSGRGCGDPTGSLFRLGLKGGLDFTKGFYGQSKNLGPGWQDGTLVDNRIGTYSNPNVDANIGGYLRTNLPFYDKNWNPAHIDIGYNYNKPLDLGSNPVGQGTHNITGKIARSGDHFAGRPGYGGIFGNKGGTSRPQYSYGIEGNYDLTNKKLTNLGAYGQIGIMGPVNVSGSAGYNFETGKPQFGLGFGARFKKGGVKKYQYGGGSGLGLNTALEFGNRGGRLFASPTYRMGNLDVGGIIGSYSTPQKGQDYWNSHGFAGGNFNLRFGNSGRNLRDYDTRFMGSLQGELGKGWTQHQNDNNNMNLSARMADPSGWNNEPPVEDPITQSSSNNFKMPLDASARLNLGVGRPGAAGCFGGMCYTAPVLPWNISAFGEYGTKQSLRPNFNVGLSGRYGPVTGEYSYNVNTKQPGFKVGLNIPLFNRNKKTGGLRKMQTGGEAPVYAGMIPEVEVSALSDKSYNELSDAQKQVYDIYKNINDNSFTQYVPYTLSDKSKGYLHWKDALNMVKQSGVGNIYNKPRTNNPKFKMDNLGRFRAHAKPSFMNRTTGILYPVSLTPLDRLTKGLSNKYFSSGDIYIPSQSANMGMTKTVMSPDGNVNTILSNEPTTDPGEYFIDSYGRTKNQGGFEGEEDFYFKKLKEFQNTYGKEQYMQDLIAELAHIDPSVRVNPWFDIPTYTSRLFRYYDEGEWPDASNYRSPFDYEYYTHYAPNSSERKLIKKYSRQPYSEMTKSEDYGHLK